MRIEQRRALEVVQGVVVVPFDTGVQAPVIGQLLGAFQPPCGGAEVPLVVERALRGALTVEHTHTDRVALGSGKRRAQCAGIGGPEGPADPSRTVAIVDLGLLLRHECVAVGLLARAGVEGRLDAVIQQQISGGHLRAIADVVLNAAEGVHEIGLDLVAVQQVGHEIDDTDPRRAQPFQRTGARPALGQRLGIQQALAERVVILAVPGSRLHVENAGHAIAKTSREDAAEEVESGDRLGVENAEQRLHILIVVRLEERHPIEVGCELVLPAAADMRPGGHRTGRRARHEAHRPHRVLEQRGHGFELLTRDVRRWTRHALQLIDSVPARVHVDFGIFRGFRSLFFGQGRPLTFLGRDLWRRRELYDGEKMRVHGVQTQAMRRQDPAGDFFGGSFAGIHGHFE